MSGRRPRPATVSWARTLRILASGAVFGLALSLSPAGVAAQGEAKIPTELEAIRSSLAKYNDLEVAAQDLYISALGCIEYGLKDDEGEGVYQPSGVAMLMMNGAEFMDGGKVDPYKPEVIIYEQVNPGEFRLGGAMWMVPAADVTEPPHLFGHEFRGPFVVEGKSQLMPVKFEEYELYVWLWKENPEGLFTPANPELPCPKDGYSLRGNPK